jgi:hypothetical protein
LPATRVRIFFPPVVTRRQPTSCDLEMGIGIGEGRGGIRTRVLILERSQVVDILVDNNVEVVGLVVRCHVCLGEGLRHLALCLS